jgi:hypothetical protein
MGWLLLRRDKGLLVNACLIVDLGTRHDKS